MTQQIRLDNDADHEISDSGTSGTVYLLMPYEGHELPVEIYFETDDRQNINLLSVGDSYPEVFGLSDDCIYTLQFEHEPAIKAVINKFLRDNPIDDSEPCDYDTAASLGFSNSDFLYG